MPVSRVCFFAALIFNFELSIARSALVLSDLNDYTNNFDYLNKSGTNSWTDDQAFESSSGSPGWYWQNGLGALTYRGSVPLNSGPYSLAIGPPLDPLSDRAMGGVSDNTSASGSVAHLAWGIVFQNNTGATITQLDVAYQGEQYRKSSTIAETLHFSYTTSSTEITDLLPASGATPLGWTAFTNLSFTSPIPPGTPPFFDAGQFENEESISDVITVNVPDGEYIALRWYDGDIAGSDAALAIDDLTVGFSAVAIPEPSAFLFFMFMMSGWAVRKCVRHDART